MTNEKTKCNDKIKIKNKITLLLAITQNNDNTYKYKYLNRMSSGVEVNLEGLYISEPTEITVQLISPSSTTYEIVECLIPCDQETVTAEITELFDRNGKKYQTVTIIDRDNEPEPEDYNFVIIAKNQHTDEQIVCDPQIRNRGTM